MQKLLFLILILLISCTDKFDEEADCALGIYNTDRKTYKVIEQEPSILKRYRDTDTTFWYVIWDDGDFPTTLVFPELPLDPERIVPNLPLEISGNIKITCPEAITIDDRPTRAILFSKINIIEYCPVDYTFDNNRRPLINTNWRFVGFDTGSSILHPTCNESFLTLRFTTNNTIPETEDNLFYVEIYNGRDRCFYTYRPISSNFYNIRRINCQQTDIGSTLAAQQYGRRMMLGLLDLDGMVLSQSGNLLTINPENLGDNLLFVAQ